MHAKYTHVRISRLKITRLEAKSFNADGPSIPSWISIVGTVQSLK